MGTKYETVVDHARCDGDSLWFHVLKDLTPEERVEHCADVVMTALERRDDEGTLRALKCWSRAVDDIELLPVHGQDGSEYHSAWERAQKTRFERFVWLCEQFAPFWKCGLGKTRKYLYLEMAEFWHGTKDDELADTIFRCLNDQPLTSIAEDQDITVST